MRCTAARWCALVGLVLHSVGAIPAGLYAPARRAIGAIPEGPADSSSAPYMTLKPFHPVGKSFGPPVKRGVVAPGGASPWGPAPPAPPAVDPSYYSSKKAEFLGKLFSGLGPATGGAPPVGPVVSPDFWAPPTPAPAGAPADDGDDVTQAQMLAQLVQAVVNAPEPTDAPLPPMLFVPPTPKPTIVPPGFWVPDSPIVAPGTYKAKVATFLSKLFSSLNITGGAAGGAAAGGARVVRHSRPNPWERSVPPSGAAPADPKDVVVNSILSEVAQLKGAFMDTLADMMIKQKELVAIAAATPVKKPKFIPPWLPTPPPTPDPLEPYQKRIQNLGQVFDMLTALGQEVTAPASSASSPAAAAVNVSVPSSRVIRSAPTRSVQMAVHQGYQSMPPGTEELISAGAGRDPDSTREGGGLNLKIKVPQ